MLVLFFRAKGLDCPGSDLENILMLETPEDARRIHYSCINNRIVVVGTSFVGAPLYPFMWSLMIGRTVFLFKELKVIVREYFWHNFTHKVLG